MYTNPKIILPESGAFMSGQSGFVIVKLAQIICCNFIFTFSGDFSANFCDNNFLLISAIHSEFVKIIC